MGKNMKTRVGEDLTQRRRQGNDGAALREEESNKDHIKIKKKRFGLGL